MVIDREDTIDAICAVCGNDCDKSEFLYNAPQDEQIILCPEHYALTQLPSAEPTICGYDIEHLRLIAEVLRRERLSPERVAEVITDMGKIFEITHDEFEQMLRKAVEQCEI